jgi:hypothetical protein
MLEIHHTMENQQFYTPNSNNPTPRFPNLQFRSFNPEPKPASEAEKNLSLDTKPTQTPGGSEACVEEEPRAKTVASPIDDTGLRDSVHVETPSMCKGKTGPNAVRG